MEERLKKLEEKVTNQSNVIEELLDHLYSLSIQKDNKVTFSEELVYCLQDLRNKV